MAASWCRDRFLDSSLAYQGGARGLGVDEVERINRFATGGLAPDLTFLLEIDPADGRRARRRERPLRGRGRRRCRSAVREAYERLAAAEPGALAPRRRRPRARGRCTPTCSPRWRPRAAAPAHERRRWPAPRTTRRRGWCWPRRLEAGPSHAYLFHGPAGTGKRTAARAFAAELLAEGQPDPDAVRLRVRARHPSRPDLGAADAART